MLSNLLKLSITNISLKPLANAGPALAGGILGSIAALIPAVAPAAGLGGGFAAIAGGIIALLAGNKRVELYVELLQLEIILRIC
jgi:hypothetical protein